MPRRPRAAPAAGTVGPSVGDVVMMHGLTSSRVRTLNMCLGMVEAVRHDGRRVVRPFTQREEDPRGTHFTMHLLLERPPVALRAVNLKNFDPTDRRYGVHELYITYLTYEAEALDREAAEEERGIPSTRRGSTSAGVRACRAWEELHRLQGDALSPLFKLQLARYKLYHAQRTTQSLELAAKLLSQLVAALPADTAARADAPDARIRHDLAFAMLVLGRFHAALDVALSMRRDTRHDDEGLYRGTLFVVAEKLRETNDDCELIALDAVRASCIQHNEDHALPHYHIGRFHARRNRPILAKAALTRALECSSRDQDALSEEDHAGAVSYVEHNEMPKQWKATSAPGCSRSQEIPFEVPVRRS